MLFLLGHQQGLTSGIANTQCFHGVSSGTGADHHLRIRHSGPDRGSSTLDLAASTHHYNGLSKAMRLPEYVCFMPRAARTVATEGTAGDPVVVGVPANPLGAAYYGS